MKTSEEKKLDFKYIIIVCLVVIALIAVLVLVNTGIVDTKVIDKRINDLTPSKEIVTTERQNKTITLNISGVNKTIYLETVYSHLGFSIEYDVDYFDYDTYSDSSVLFIDKNNNNNYFKIIKLSADDYNKEYEKYQTEEVVYENTKYLFYRIGKNYFKIVENIDIDLDNSEEVQARYNYMVSSLREH